MYSVDKKKEAVRSLLNVPENHTGKVAYGNGAVCWLKDGLIHRLDGPASIWENGNKFWLRKGKRHCIEGPAVVRDKKREYWIEGKKCSKKEFDRKTSLIQQQLPKRDTDYKHLTTEEWYEYLDALLFK